MVAAQRIRNVTLVKGEKKSCEVPLQYSKTDLVINSIQDKKGEDIVVLNLENIPG